MAAVGGEGQPRMQRWSSLVHFQKVGRVSSLGTKANMGALKFGNFSHNASLSKRTAQVKALGVTGSLEVLSERCAESKHRNAD